MVVERSADEFIIRMPVIPQIERVQEVVDYLRYLELTAGYETQQDDIDNLAREINKKWREEYESRS